MIASSYKLTAILFGMGVTLHNLEEAMFRADWSRSHLKLRFEPNPRIYWVLTSLVSVVIWIPVVGVCVSKERSSFQSALSGFALAMAINAVLPHFIISLVKRSYSPGTGTGAGGVLGRPQSAQQTQPLCGQHFFSRTKRHKAAFAQ